MRIGFDLDGVWYDFRQSLSDYLVATGRSDCTVANAAPHWDFFKGWGMSVGEFMEAYRESVDCEFMFINGEPYPGAVESSAILANAGHSIHVVTDRSVGSKRGASSILTAKWLAENGFIFDSLTFTSDKTSVHTDAFVDDRAENYLALKAAGVNAYLLTRPWNKHVPNAKRARSALDFSRKLIATGTKWEGE